jgi:hypothetical protein
MLDRLIRKRYAIALLLQLVPPEIGRGLVEDPHDGLGCFEIAPLVMASMERASTSQVGRPLLGQDWVRSSWPADTALL